MSKGFNRRQILGASLIAVPLLAATGSTAFASTSFNFNHVSGNNKVTTFPTDSRSQKSIVDFQAYLDVRDRYYLRAVARKENDSYSFYATVVSYTDTTGKTMTIHLERNNNGTVTILDTKTVPRIAPQNIRIEISVRGTRPVFAHGAVINKSTGEKYLVDATDWAYQTVLGDKYGSSAGYAVYGKSYDGTPRSINAQHSIETFDVAPGARYVEGWGYPVFEDTFEDKSLSQWKVRGEKYEDYVGYDSGVILAKMCWVDDNNVLNVGIEKRDTARVFKGDTLQKERWYNTGHMISNFQQEFGRFEARMRIPASRQLSAGFWSGFWLRMAESVIGGEIDIAEVFGSDTSVFKDNTDPTNRADSTIHFTQNGAERKTLYPSIQKFSPSNENSLEDEWHIWTCEWTPDYVAFFLDGVEYQRVRVADYKDRFAKGFPSGKEMQIRFCTQASSPDSYWGSIDNNTNLPQTMQVDYVRAWAYKK